MIPAKDGNYVMADATGSGPSGAFDIWLVKVNGDGDLLCSKTFTGPNSDAGFSVAEMEDGGYAVTGYWGVTSSDSDVAIIRTDKDGNAEWDRMYPLGSHDWGKSVTEYKVWGLGTLVAFLTAFLFGVTYAVPARTVINNASKLSLKEQAIVYLSGPMVSAILAIAFLLLVPFGGILRTIGLLGGSMNLLSAVYSLTPINAMDGGKVYRWKKALRAITFVPLLLLYLGVTILLA